MNNGKPSNQRDFTILTVASPEKNSLDTLLPEILTKGLDIQDGDCVIVTIKRNRHQDTVEKLSKDLNFLQRRNSDLKALIRRMKKKIRAAKKEARRNARMRRKEDVSRKGVGQ